MVIKRLQHNNQSVLLTGPPTEQKEGGGGGAENRETAHELSMTSTINDTRRRDQNIFFSLSIEVGFGLDKAM